MAMQGPGGEVGAPLTQDEVVGGLSEDEIKRKIEEAEKIPDVLVALFTYHEPTLEQIESYKRIRYAAMVLARVINDECPAGPDRTAAVRKVREAVMVANASIATNNAQYR